MSAPDVLVVGAGPGGASAAFHLARAGRSVVVLDRATFPRDKSCGDGLTMPAVAALHDMGVLDELRDPWEVRGGTISFAGRGTRVVEYTPIPELPCRGLVVPRLELDHAIVRRARAAGADVREGVAAERLVVRDGAVVGVGTSDGAELHARAVVVASGAASRLVESAGFGAPAEPGYAVRGYYEGIDGLTDLLQVEMPLNEPTDRYYLPAYGWVFPVGPDLANIGVGVVRREHDANLRALMDSFLDRLREDPRFARMRLRGRWRGAPLRFDFRPESCTPAPGLTVVGDAAGMVSPFSGEGISFALESGRLAAEALADRLASADGEPFGLEAYEKELRDRYVGYFETGRRLARRHALVWRVLDSTFDNDGPIFDLVRRLAIFPETAGDLYSGEITEDAGPVLGPLRLRIEVETLAASEVVVDATREDWPHLAQLFAGGGARALGLRPALLLLLTGGLGSDSRHRLAPLAAAVELGTLAAVAQMSVGDAERPRGSAGAVRDWGTIFALMVADFLLARALRLFTEADAEQTVPVCRSLARMAAGRMRQIRLAERESVAPEEQMAAIEAQTGELCALACTVGARATSADERLLAAVEDYGRALGVTFQVVEDCRRAAGETSLFGQPLRAYPSGTSSIVARAGAAHAAELARTSADRARAALDGLPAGEVREALARLVDHVIGRLPAAEPAAA